MVEVESAQFPTEIAQPAADTGVGFVGEASGQEVAQLLGQVSPCGGEIIVGEPRSGAAGFDGEATAITMQSDVGLPHFGFAVQRAAELSHDGADAL